MDKIRSTQLTYDTIFKKFLKFFLSFFIVSFNDLSAQWDDSLSLRNIDYTIQTGILSNDLKILYLKNNQSPIATIEWALFPGTIIQKPEQEGMLALLDKFLLRPTQKDLSPIHFQNRISDLGLSNESTIYTESIHFQWLLPSKYLREGLILLKDCWFTPKWIDLEFQREKILLAHQIQQAELSPTWFLYREMMLKILGKNHISRQTIAADYFNIQKIELQHLKNFKNRYFTPQNTILAISSSQDFHTILHWSDSLFADWKNSPSISILDSVQLELKHPASAFIITSEKAQLPIAAVSFPFKDSLTLKNFLIGSLIAQIFNSKYSLIGKFFYSNDLGYQLVCNYKPSVLFSEFLFSIAIKKEKLEYTLDFIRHFPVYAYHANWINARDLEAAKNQLKIDYFIQNQTPWQILHKISQSYFMFNHLDYLHYLDTLETITFDDLQNFFQKSINIPNPMVGFLMNSEDIKGSEIEKKIEDFWVQPFGPIYDLIDPEHKIIPIPTALNAKDSVKLTSIDSIAFKDTTQSYQQASLNPIEKLDTIPTETTLENIISQENKIYFEFNSTNIDKPSLILLDKLANILHAYSNIKLKLIGHTDSSGPEEFNLKLSLQRANKVKEYLVKKYQIASERILTEGKGESQLAFPEDTPQNKAKNRRVEIKIWVNN